MEWWLILILICAGLLFLLSLGVPVSLSFLGVNIVGVFIFWGGAKGLMQLTLSMYESINKFTLLPLPLFILMGEVMFHSGVAPKMMDALDKFLGRLPGRLSVLAVVGGALFGTLSGSSMAGAAVLGSVLIPEMEKHGYKHSMSIGPILGAGGLAIMIPPSALGVLLAAIARISVGDFMVAILVPGLCLTLCFLVYIVIRCIIQPELAPAYTVTETPLALKIKLFFRYIFPLGGIIFLVVGLVFLGIATPTESAALGAAGCFALAYYFNGFNWEMIKKSVLGSVKVSIMMFMILTGSTAFSQLLGFTGASEGLVNFAISFNLPPLGFVFIAQIVLLIMGTFMEPLSILMITVPIFMPIVSNLGLSPIWFGVIMLLNMEMANTTPPFGLTLFVMKGVAPAGTKMMDIYQAGIPFLICDAVVMALIIFFPNLILWLPSLMN